VEVEVEKGKRDKKAGCCGSQMKWLDWWTGKKRLNMQEHPDNDDALPEIALDSGTTVHCSRGYDELIGVICFCCRDLK